MKISCNKSNPPLGGLMAAELYRSSVKEFEIVWGSESHILLPNSSKPVPYGTSNDLIRILENAFNKSAGPLQKVTMNHWLSFSLVLDEDISQSVQYLDKILGPLTYLVGESLSVSDLAVFSVLNFSSKFKDVSGKISPTNILRWMKLIQAQEPVVNVLKQIPDDVLNNISKSPRRSPAATKEAGGRLAEGKFIELPHAEMGKVVVRFPPEASGYLHIGHAKAALLNQYYQQAFEGKLVMRFDDTNPAKENADFEKVILEDVEMLEIKPDMFTHTSQYFDMMMDFCVKLIKENKAFVDDTPAEQMKNERDQKVESKNRNNSVEKNLELWEEMKKGSSVGVQCCVRAKIDMQSANGCLRDPTIYRCKPETHPRTGNQYKVYPTYDFACPIVDSVEGVTHVLRTMEYHDRDPQFYWFIDALGLRKPYIWEYSRLSMTNTVLSKRKLTWFVEQGLVDGWDDPRMPTVRGVLRRGMTVEGLRQFIRAQGSSRSVVFMEWDKIWAINKKVIDPIAPRYTALEANPVPVNLQGVSGRTPLSVPLHPKNPDVGVKTVWVTSRLLIDQADAIALKQGENATFINYGNVMIDKIHKDKDGKVTSIDATPNLDNKDFKKTLKLTWLSNDVHNTVETYCVFFDHIISKPVLGKDEDFKQYIGHQTRWEMLMVGEPELSKVAVGDIIQLQRRGFFRVDVAPGSVSFHTGRPVPLVLFHVPDGHTKEMPGQPKTAQATPVKQEPKKADAAGDSSKLNEEIVKQGEIVRSLKAAKTDKAQVDQAVKVLLNLKAKYKTATGQDWKPITPVQAPASGDASSLSQQITQQGDLVRSLKTAKADKPKVDEAVKALLQLKAKYKAATGQEWKPGTSPPSVTSPSSDVTALNQEITEQGDAVRSLKASKADKAKVDEAVKVLLELKTKYKTATGQIRTIKAAKAEKTVIDVEVKNLLNLKAQYKSITGKDWTPSVTPAQDTKKTDNKKQAAAPANGDMEKAASLSADIAQQGDRVRELKTNKADKATIDAEVKKLLELKAQYQTETGSAYVAPTQPREAKPKEKKPKEEKKDKPKEDKKDKTKEVKKEPKAKEPSPKPAKEESSSGVKKITRLGLEASKETDLSEWYSQVITKSEMIDYYDISGCYILRPWSYSIWEHIRNYLSKELKKLGVKDGYFPIFVSKVKNHILHVLSFRNLTNIINGKLTERISIKFGRGIQGATSHHLGQNFSKMFEIVYDDPDTQEKKYVYQNSWGITTRTIGVMILVHGDDRGLVLPPRVAEVQAVVVPCGITASSSPEERKTLIDSCKELVDELIKGGVRAEGDYRDNYSPGWKFNHWELKGVPIRVELGPKDMSRGEVVAVRRVDGAKRTIKREAVATELAALLEQTHAEMFEKATKERDSRLSLVNKWENFVAALEQKHILLAPFCGDIPCEDRIKGDSAKTDDDTTAEVKGPAMGAKSLCIPFKQPRELTKDDRCIHPECNNKPKFITLFGRSY
ncbi:PREDICTED: bifunctional glutamate/proline--tRNA ligase [Papilio polytes]|uniref:bifunctional glutamate/proline--tRNA ligase n=1 Tax=Papilio polytes TaxID=76194 RepID=UPI00067648C4|nr:PREDICTED: bifunctional glutamate/proline--tRNA ligase [Papilio polytes]